LKRIILGTAGHVDHGKTALVRRMTGIDTDRLKEEKARGITIDLGFAPFELPGGQRIGIVDVPGHERFVRNMLAGATGIDLVLFVIAANEGVMPQTREHMDILRLLGVCQGAVALTKIDIVDDEWLGLIRGEVNEFLADSPLNGCPVVEVSAATGEGIPELLKVLGELCDKAQSRSAAGKCRLAIDRVFTMTGFGTVVTGTLWSGTVKTGDILESLPSGETVRARSLQVHGEKRDEAYAGERVAINVTGARKDLTERGGWLSAPGLLKASYRIDIALRLLPTAPAMRQRTRVRVHHGTAETLARVILLDRETLAPGEDAYAQLELETAIAALRGDKLILRFYSPVFTIGGGTVLDEAAYRHKLSDKSVLTRLRAIENGDPQAVLSAAMSADRGLWLPSRVATCLGVSEEEARALIDMMVDNGELLRLPDDFYISAESFEAVCERLSSWLSAYLADKPLRFGAPKQDAAKAISQNMGLREQRALFAFLEACAGEWADAFSQDEKTIRPKGWTPKVSGKYEKWINAIRDAYGRSLFAPPQWREALESMDISPADLLELYAWFTQSGELINVGQDILFAARAIGEAEAALRLAYPRGGFGLAEVRDLLNTSRRYAQLLCEYFDSVNLTRRDGEKRLWIS